MNRLKEIFWKLGEMIIEYSASDSFPTGQLVEAIRFCIETLDYSAFRQLQKRKEGLDTQLNVEFRIYHREAGNFQNSKTNDNFPICEYLWSRVEVRFFYLSTQLDARTQLLAGYKVFLVRQVAIWKHV